MVLRKHLPTRTGLPRGLKPHQLQTRCATKMFTRTDPSPGDDQDICRGGGLGLHGRLQPCRLGSGCGVGRGWRLPQLKIPHRLLHGMGQQAAQLRGDGGMHLTSALAWLERQAETLQLGLGHGDCGGLRLKTAARQGLSQLTRIGPSARCRWTVTRSPAVPMPGTVLVPRANRGLALGQGQALVRHQQAQSALGHAPAPESCHVCLLALFVHG